MITYRITHRTHYAYSSTVSYGQNQVMLFPREEPYVELHSHRLSISPEPDASSSRLDFFGNRVNTFSVMAPHQDLEITATSRVTIHQQLLPSPDQTMAWEALTHSLDLQADSNWLDVCPFRQDSPRIERNLTFADYARASFVSARPVLAAALDLTDRIYHDFAYETDATSVNTSPAEAFALRKGVCQDFAHVQITCLRSLGIPARYTSGYLRTIPPPGKKRLIGADQSHAWVSVYCGAGLWVDLDPTNNQVVGLDHIVVAYGRDYDDVAPVKGVFLGGGAHTLNVSVDVCPNPKH